MSAKSRWKYRTGVRSSSEPSDNGIPIFQLVGHSSTAVTELVYRKQIRPVLQGGAVVMNRIFKS